MYLISYTAIFQSYEAHKYRKIHYMLFILCDNKLEAAYCG